MIKCRSTVGCTYIAICFFIQPFRKESFPLNKYGLSSSCSCIDFDGSCIKQLHSGPLQHSAYFQTFEIDFQIFEVAMCTLLLFALNH